MPHRSLAAALLTFSLVSHLSAAKKKPEDITQILELPKDPPQAIAADSSRLTFQVAPLSAKGLLSQQVRDGVKALLSAARGGSIVKIRAFVAGSGDMRRVPQIVSEIFTEKRLPLPVVSVIQVGGLPLVGAQLSLESIAIDKKTATPNGIGLFSGVPAKAAQAGIALEQAGRAAGLEPEHMRRITCFLNSLDFGTEVREQIASKFPKAVIAFVQLQRDTGGDFVECEAVASLATTPPKPLFLFQPQAGAYSAVALVGPGKIVISGTQLAFRQTDEDVRLAFGRLSKAVEAAQGDLKKTAFTSIYALSKSVADRVKANRFEYFNTAQPPASTLLYFEGLPSLDASFAIDVIALSQP